jgi:lipopolysaccharide export LptBFGC system permease protein LptF
VCSRREQHQQRREQQHVVLHRRLVWPLLAVLACLLGLRF